MNAIFKNAIYIWPQNAEKIYLFHRMRLWWKRANRNNKLMSLQ